MLLKLKRFGCYYCSGFGLSGILLCLLIFGGPGTLLIGGVYKSKVEIIHVICIHIYVCMYVCMYVCIYLFVCLYERLGSVEGCLRTGLAPRSSEGSCSEARHNTICDNML